MIQLYHGSDFLFNRFAFVNVGKKSGTSGAGFGIYLTDNPDDATKYGKYLYTVNAEFQKELSNTKLTLRRDQVRLILRRFEDEVAKSDGNSYIECWEYDENKALTNLLKYNSSDTELINDIINATNCPIEMMNVVTSLGYTHSIDKVTPNKVKEINGKITTNYVVFDLNCLRIVKREKSEDYWKNLSESYEDNAFYEPLKNLNQFESGDKTGDSLQARHLLQDEGKSKSKSQRRLFGMALAYKRGKLDSKYASDEIKKMANSMDQETLHNYAATKQKKRRKDGSVGKRNNIPDYVKGSKYRPELKNSKSLKPK